MILAPYELAALTRGDRPTAQARVLRLLGIPFAMHPVGGNLIVSRAAIEARIGAPIGNGPSAPRPQEYDVNVDGIRQRRKTTTTY
jgi:uncharacterized protein DUF4224